MKDRDRMENGDRMKAPALAALLILVPLACQQDRGDGAGLRASVRDSAGINIVENERPPEGSRLGWRIGPEPTASIGEVEGEEPYMLHGAFDATRLPDGRIVVANLGSNELRVFDAFGTHLASWGGRGEGPGEFMELTRVEPWPGDSILAWYSHGYSVSVLDTDGNFARSFSLPRAGSDPGLWPRALAGRGDGTILAMKASEAADTAIVEIRDGVGALSASLGVHPSGEPILSDSGSRLRWVVYGRKLVTGLWGDLVVAAPTTRYEIRAFGADGAFARIVRRDHAPRTPTQADMDSYIEGQLRRWEDRPGLPEGFLEETRADLRSTPLAKTFPAFSSVKGDAAGHLWVREYDFPGEERPAPLWTVFDPAGRVLGFVETPKDLAILEIGEDYLLGNTRDDLGVERIQLWPLER